MTNKLLTKEEINNLMNWSNSFERLPKLLQAKKCMTEENFFITLGEQWSGFDNVSIYFKELSKIFRRVDRVLLDRMMTSDELEELKKLPEKICIYRGCFEINKLGFSWTTDKKNAKSFTKLLRYKRDGETPLIITGLIPKTNIVYKQDRGESEIIVTNLNELVILNEKINAPPKS